MAARPQRSSAGKNIGKLINQEVEGVRDDFYSTAYGGFGEESEDEEYAVLVCLYFLLKHTLSYKGPESYSIAL